MNPLLVIKCKETPQTLHQRENCVIVEQIQMLVFQCPPQSFNVDIVDRVAMGSWQPFFCESYKRAMISATCGVNLSFQHPPLLGLLGMA